LDKNWCKKGKKMV